MGKQQLKRALDLAGSEHRYQKMMVGLLIIGWISMMFVFLSSPFLYMEPLFHCASTGDLVLHQKQACPIINQCVPIDTFTMTSSIGLFCDLQWARVFIQACFPIGSFTGLMVMNLISDTRGRRQAFLIALGTTVVGIILLLVGSYTKVAAFLMVSQFLRGFGAESIMPLCYTLCADFLSDTMRPKAIVVLNSSGGIVSIVLGFFYIMKLNWFNFVILFQLIPFCLVFFAFYFYLQESFYILIDKKQNQKAKQVFTYIAKFNNKQQNLQQILRIVDRQVRTEEDRPSVQNVYKTVKQWKYLKTIIILIIVNGVAHMNYLGIAYSFAEVGLGYGYNSIVFGIIQFSSMLFTRHVVSKVPRKTGISLFYALTMGVGLLYFIPFVQTNKIISTLLIGVSRVFSVSANCLIACMETEAFTQEIQSTAIGLIQGLGLYGAVVAPFLVQTSQYLGVYPMAFVALFVNLAIWPPFLLKQTFKVKDRENIEMVESKSAYEIESSDSTNA